MKESKMFEQFPKNRDILPNSYVKIYNQHYDENRNGKTTASSMSSRMEHWLHKKVAKTAGYNKKTLEIGAGTLNQLKFEKASNVYDIVEPYKDLYTNSKYIYQIRNIYDDISDVPIDNKYDRITSVTCFEHICNLPEVVEKCTQLLNEDGILCVSIPNEGRILWKLAYTVTTGREFEKRYGLDYSVLMRYEHVNTADEIEMVLRYYFKEVKQSLFGIGKDLSFYRYYECK